MKRLFILTTFLLGISPICLNAQELTLEECQQQAQAHYPLIKRYGLIEKTKEYNISNAGKGYLPQVSLSAKASYQSDVTEIPVDLLGIDIRGIRKDQYQAMLQLDQVVWDGGNIRARKEVTRATSEVDKQKLEVDMYAINERVNQLFFGILLLKEQLKQNQLMQEELQRNYDNVAAYVKNGIANQADLDAVKVEQLNNIQQRHTLEATYRAYGEMLKIMINHPTPLTENTLKKPDVNALLYKGEVPCPVSTSAAAASGRAAPRSFCPLWSAPKLLFWKRLHSFQPCWPIVWNGGQTGSRAFSLPLPLPAAYRNCGSSCGTSFCW